MIITDTSSDMEPFEYRQKQVQCITLPVTFDDVVFDATDKNLFFEKLISSGVFPKTSQPSPQAFLECFLQAKERGDAVIAILISSVLSGTCQNALLAAQMADYEQIHIIDSCTATVAVKLLVDQAVSMRDAGCNADEIVRSLEDLKKRTKILAVMDTLEYLYKGGRLTRTQAGLGTLANLKPLITLSSSGAVTVIAKNIGKNRAIQSMTKELAHHMPDPAYPVLPIYSYDPKNCDIMLERLQSGFPKLPIQEKIQIGATIGTHIGPNAFGVAYISQN